MLNTWGLVFGVVGLIAIAVIAIVRARHTKINCDKSFKLLANTEMVHDLSEYKSAKRRYRILTDILIISFIVTIGAVSMLAARPTKLASKAPDYSKREIMLCVNLNEIDENKEELIKYADIIKEYKGQRVGLTAYDNVYLVLSPLSDDYNALSSLLIDLDSRSDIYKNTLAGMNNSNLESDLDSLGCVYDVTKAQNIANYDNTSGFEHVDDPYDTIVITIVCVLVVAFIIWRLGL